MFPYSIIIVASKLTNNLPLAHTTPEIHIAPIITHGQPSNAHITPHRAGACHSPPKLRYIQPLARIPRSLQTPIPAVPIERIRLDAQIGVRLRRDGTHDVVLAGDCGAVEEGGAGEGFVDEIGGSGGAVAGGVYEGEDVAAVFFDGVLVGEVLGLCEQRSEKEKILEPQWRAFPWTYSWETIRPTSWIVGRIGGIVDGGIPGLRR